MAVGSAGKARQAALLMIYTVSRRNCKQSMLLRRGHRPHRSLVRRKCRARLFSNSTSVGSRQAKRRIPQPRSAPQPLLQGRPKMAAYLIWAAIVHLAGKTAADSRFRKVACTAPAAALAAD
jgi:hypothetical protein